MMEVPSTNKVNRKYKNIFFVLHCPYVIFSLEQITFFQLMFINVFLKLKELRADIIKHLCTEQKQMVVSIQKLKTLMGINSSLHSFCNKLHKTLNDRQLPQFTKQFEFCETFVSLFIVKIKLLLAMRRIETKKVNIYTGVYYSYMHYVRVSKSRTNYLQKLKLSMLL